MSANEFDCLSNAVLQAGLRIKLPVAFTVPARVRDVLRQKNIDVQDVQSVHIHQCPKGNGVIEYRLEVYPRRGLVHLDTFKHPGLDADHDTYMLYDRMRDGPMKHLHLMH